MLRAIDNNTLLSKLPISEQGKEVDIMLPEKELKEMGYEQSFVVAYGDDNQRIELPMDEILRLYNMAK